MAVRAKSIKKYGIVHTPLKGPRGKLITYTDWMIELRVLRNYDKWKDIKGIKLLPWEEHFCRLTDIIFKDPKGIWPFEWNPNALRILRNFRRHRILAIAGCASSGKTHAMALIAVMMFWIDPKNTKVLVTSITASAASGRVWGHVKNCWSHMESFFGKDNMPGKLIDSKNKIRYEVGDHKDETRGIELVVGEQSQAKASAAKIQGIKSPKLILMGDEFAELHHSLIRTALSNLKRNDEFWFVAGFNPTSIFGPDGAISRPKNGWHTVTEDTPEWETELEEYGYKGFCIRFDGEKSPNVLEGWNRWKGLLKVEDFKEAQRNGTKTAGYYQQIKAFWITSGEKDAIYSSADIIKWQAGAKVKRWIDVPTMVAGLDPAYKHGGDRAALAIGKIGLAEDPLIGKVQKVFELIKIYSLDEDVTDTSIDKSEWVVKLTKEKLKEHGVDVRNLAVDGTGGGDPFMALLARDIGLGALNVKFSEKASDKPVSKNDTRRGFERFKNMATELWMVGKELIRTGQLKGLVADVMSEMVARSYTEASGKIAIEPKYDMKLRTKKSPDFADATFLALHLARMRHGLTSNEAAAPRPASKTHPNNLLFPPYDFNRKPQQQTRPAYISIGGGWHQGIA
jgi:hypothetical protein